MKKNVGVIGGGPMGLAVAYELLKRGHRVTLYESNEVLGGMSASFDFSGTRIERYYHFICAGDHPLFDMLGELGILDRLSWTRTKMGYLYRGHLNDWGSPLALFRFKGAHLGSKIRYGLHAFFSVKRSDWKPLDPLEATTWIRKWIGKEGYRIWWKNLFDLKFHQFAGNLSAAWIWTRIKRVGTSRYNLFHEKLGYLENGSDTLLNALKEVILQRGGTIRLSTPVEKVHMDNGSVQGVFTECSFTPHDVIVSTIPLPYVNLLIPDLPENLSQKFQAVKNIGVVCVLVKLRKPLTQNFWLNINDERMDIPGLVEYTNLRPMDHTIVYVPFYLPGDHPKYFDSDDRFMEKVRYYLKIINPDLEDGDFLDIQVNRYLHAQPICGPNFLETLPPVALPIKGLFVADTSYYYPEDRGISESLRFGRIIAEMVNKGTSHE